MNRKFPSVGGLLHLYASSPSSTHFQVQITYIQQKKKKHTEPYIIPATPPPEVRTFGLKLGHATQIRTSTKLSPRHKNRCVLDFSGNENSGANTSIGKAHIHVHSPNSRPKAIIVYIYKGTSRAGLCPSHLHPIEFCRVAVVSRIMLSNSTIGKDSDKVKVVEMLHCL